MSTRRFFLHHEIGYRANPFGALTAVEWTAVSFLPPNIQQIVEDGFVHLQLIGPKGSGKTTTLHNLTDHFRQQGKRVIYEYIAEGQHHFDTDLTLADIFVLDEAQRLNWRQRRIWLKSATAVTCIFSSHQDLTPHFKRRNLPLTAVAVDEVISEAHYQRWLDKRFAYFALPDVPGLCLTEEAVRFLHATFGKDMRAAEYFLYEVFQQKWETLQIDAPDLEMVLAG